jgi:hypothetical protein
VNEHFGDYYREIYARGLAGERPSLRMLLAELDLTLALSGYTKPSELDREALDRAPSD